MGATHLLPLTSTATTHGTGMQSTPSWVNGEPYSSLQTLSACSSETVGRYEPALANAAAGRGTELVDALIGAALAHRSFGMLSKALVELERARALAEEIGDPVRQARALSQMGDICLLAGALKEAERRLEMAYELAEPTGEGAITAHVLNNLGNVRLARGAIEESVTAYSESLRLAEQAGERGLASSVSINLVHARMSAGDLVRARADLESAIAIMNTLPESRDKVFTQLSIGKLARALYKREPAWRSELMPLARRTFETVGLTAKKHAWPEEQALAYGYLGGLYEESDQRGIALRLTQSAIFLSQQAQARESIHLWYWQLGRIRRDEGQLEAAIAAYQLAVDSLQKVRLELERGTRLRGKTFREVSAPMYFELADLLLQHPSSDRVEQGEQARLFEARRTIELLKAAELEDYFQDNCVVELQERTGELDVIIGPRTAVLYLIPLEKRLELLVSLSGGMQRFTVPVSSVNLGAQVLEFRRNLENRTHRRYLRNAWQLYDWIIRPIDDLLTEKGVETLVLVPYGALATIPMSALHDRERKSFLIERYAVATTPGLKLTDPGELTRDGADILLGGLSEGVQGFSPLPYVPAELRGIEQVFGGTTLENERFLAKNLLRELTDQSYTIVHIASHGQFDSDPNKTFLLAYDRKINLDEVQALIGLSEFRKRPVELLTLSACETAAGDEKAALGLAGVAVKSGARSALATLWAVNDEATSLVVVAFYEHLKSRDMSKAQALRKAQIAMLEDLRYRHPAYWSPYLLIGNWQ